MVDYFFGTASIICGPLIYALSKKRYEYNTKYYNELQSKVEVVTTTTDLNKINDGELVYINSEFKVNTSTIKDPILGVNFENCPGFSRTVEMYQFGATVREASGKEAPNNSIMWSTSRLSNSKNLVSFPFTTKDYYNTGLSIGPFRFSSDFIKQYSKFNEKVHLTSKDITHVPLTSFDDDTIEKNAERKRHEKDNPSWENRLKTTRMGSLCIVMNEMNYQPGDLKITYQSAGKSGTATVLGRKNGTTVDPYNDKEGSIFYFNFGSHSLNEIFDDYKHSAYNSYVITNVIGSFVFLVGTGIFAYIIHDRNKKKK